MELHDQELTGGTLVLTTTEDKIKSCKLSKVNLVVRVPTVFIQNIIKTQKTIEGEGIKVDPEKPHAIVEISILEDCQLPPAYYERNIIKA